jgi:hypothetical protein
MSGLTEMGRNSAREAIVGLINRKKELVLSQHKIEYDLLEKQITAKVDAEMGFMEWEAQRKKLEQDIDDAKKAYKYHTTEFAKEKFNLTDDSRHYYYNSDDGRSCQARDVFNSKCKTEFERALLSVDYWKEVVAAEDIKAEVDVMITMATSPKALNSVYEFVAEALGLQLSNAMKNAIREGKGNL